jgi:iron(III) transport system ATP-binding protein
VANVSIRGLTKRFGGATPITAIDNLDLEIEEGEFLVLLGPSGCGKTTTLRCIAGLETAEEGTISFGDHVMFDGAKTSSSRRTSATSAWCSSPTPCGRT